MFEEIDMQFSLSIPDQEAGDDDKDDDDTGSVT
jgi:hypothetical protein